MYVIISQVVILFAFAATGFVLAKCGAVNKDHSVILSKLLVNIFLPAGIFKTFTRYCTVVYISENINLIVVSTVILIIVAVLSFYLAKLLTKDKTERAIFEYSLIIPNFSYMGYSFAETLFGPLGLMNAIMFAIPMSVYTYTYGYCNLSRKRFTLRNLINPIMVSLVLGAVVGISEMGRYIPDMAMSFLDSASVCMAPVSMLLTGIVVSEYGIKKSLKDPKLYIVSAMRLVLLPIAMGLVLLPLNDTVVLRNAVLLYCMPCGLNTIIFVKNVGENCEPGAGLALISNVAAILSVPLVLTMFGINR